jgi:integrase/recombinase XerD
MSHFNDELTTQSGQLVQVFQIFEISLGDRQLIDLWLHGKAVNTQSSYCRYANQFLAHCQKPIAQVTLGDIQAFDGELVDKQIADSSRKFILSAIKSLLTFSQKLGYIPVNAGVALKTPKVKDDLAERIISEADVLMMMRSEANPRNRILIMALYYTGMRVSEAVSLKWRDCVSRDGKGQITIYGKGGKTRNVLVPQKVWKEMQSLEQKKQRHPDGYVFQSQKPGRMDRKHAYLIIKEAGEKIGVKVSPHFLRHAHASHSLERGAAIHLVSTTLGHSSVAVTSRYLHARPSDSSAMYLI